MILKNPILIILIVLHILISGCGDKKQQVNKPEKMDLPELSLNLHFSRFEEDIFQHQLPYDSVAIADLRNKYGKFFDLWCSKLAGIIPTGGSIPANDEIAKNLNQYVQDKYIRLVYDDCKMKFNTIDFLKEEFTDVFKRYSVLFPGKPIPGIITYVSPFTSNCMAMDSLLGIGLHFYLGADYKYYQTLGLPQYMTRKFSREYILPDAIDGWLDSEYSSDTVHKSFLNQMVYQGKILYSLDMLIPDLEDSLKIGYTEKQTDWAIQNEGKVWAFIIEQELLYNTNPKEYMKFINDGSGTSGFPKEAPSKLGAFIGWQIVRSFMQKHPQTKLSELFSIQDGQLILAQSGYKPQKLS